jgi:Protein of unknown function (DUF3604)
MTRYGLFNSSAAVITLLFAAGAAQAQSPTGPVITGGSYAIDSQTTSKALNTRGYSPYAGRKYPTRVFWGDEHVHTGWSVDAGAAGATLGPEEALRFARGEEVVSSTGQPAKLSRPLDWVAITDHSDGAGTIFGIRDGDPQLIKNPQIKKWHELMAAGEGTQVITEMIIAQSNNKVPPEIKDPAYVKDVWQKGTAIMEK